MAKKKTKKTIASLTHEEASRKNIPKDQFCQEDIHWVIYMINDYEVG